MSSTIPSLPTMGKSPGRECCAPVKKEEKDTVTPPPGMTQIKPIADRSYPFHLYKGDKPGSGGSSVSETYFVNTADLTAALDIIDKHGRLIICGPPGSGKTRLADAVYKVLFGRGYEAIQNTKNIKTCHSHTEYHQKGGKRHVVVEDGSLGLYRCSRDTYTRLLSFLCDTQALWDRPAPSAEVFSAVVILTAHPHILQDLRNLEHTSPIHLADPKVVHQLTQDPQRPGVPLTRDLQRWSWFIQDMIGSKDENTENGDDDDDEDMTFGGRGRYRGRYSRSHDRDEDKKENKEKAGRGPLIVALCMFMQGKHHILQHTETMEAETKRLGFPGLSAYSVAEAANYLQGFLLAPNGEGFIDRFFYDACGLAVGRASSAFLALTACDPLFMTKFMRMEYDVQESRKHPYLAVSRCHEGSYRLFMDKLYKGLVEQRRLEELVQHPSLDRGDLVTSLDQYCSHRKNHAERLMSVTDPRHDLPLLYWSVWSGGPYLNQWCLTQARKGVKKMKQVTDSFLTSLLGCILFSELGERKQGVLGGIVKDMVHLKFHPDRDIELLLPLLSPVREDAGKKGLENTQRRLRLSLCFLEDVDLPVPPSLIRASLASPEAVQVRISCRTWYLALRMLTDETTEDKDDKGNTLLSMAAEGRHDDILRTLVRARAGGRSHRPRFSMRRLMAMGMDRDFDSRMDMMDMMGSRMHRDYQMRMYRDMDARMMRYMDMDPDFDADMELDMMMPAKMGRRHMHRGGHSSGHGRHAAMMPQTALHEAAGEGLQDVVLLLLQHGYHVDDRDMRGNTPLHMACRAGHKDMAQLLLKRKADINAVNRDNLTPLLEASAKGNNDLITLLVKHGADINAESCPP